jgi:beta-galactosidase
MAMASSVPAADPFLVELYDSLHASPTQLKFRGIAPMPVGVVFVQRPGEGQQEIREHFRTMRRLGFTALTDIRPVPGWEKEQIALLAVEEGIVPWWYGEAGWDTITPGLRKLVKIDANAPMSVVRDNERIIAYQSAAMKKRVERIIQARLAGSVPNSQAPACIPDMGRPGIELARNDRRIFVQWCQLRYGNIETLNKVYNLHHHGLGQPFQSWEDFANRWPYLPRREMRLSRDIFRFKAERRLERTKEWVGELMAFDSSIPFRAGGEMGMFYPTPYWGVDMESIADLMKDAGSFSPSIRLAWDFNEVEHEITRPAYIQASLAADIFKGGWSVAWESSGGPQLISGQKKGNVFTVDERTTTQLMLSQLAGGLRGFEIGCWSSRSAGGQAGDSALLDRHNKATPRTIRAGLIGQAAREHRDELWAAHKEPVVGIYLDWENDAVFSALSIEERDELRQYPMQARVGICRALINANIPFEFVTPSDLGMGLAGRYAIVYLPAVLAMRESTLLRLRHYVLQGGRVVLDAPSAWYDETTALLSTDRGTLFETMFGVVINDFQGAGVNRPYLVDRLEVTGFVIDATPTHANVLATFNNGKPAVTEFVLGKGTAVVLGYEASRMCFWQGSRRAQQLLLRYAMGPYGSPYRCRGELLKPAPGGFGVMAAGTARPIAYRLAAPTADHYFVINDGPAIKATLETDAKYVKMIDAVTREELPLADPFVVEDYSGRWLRLVK